MADIKQLRMRSLYGNSGNKNREITPPVNSPIRLRANYPNDDNSPEGYEPHHEMYDKMVGTAGRMPRRDAPSTLHKIGSAVSRLSGFGPSMYDNAGNALGLSFNQNQARESQDYFENSNFGRKMTDWKQEYDVAKDQASEEGRRNADKRIAETALTNAEIQRQRADTTEAHYRDMDEYYKDKTKYNEAQLTEKQRQFDEKSVEFKTKSEQADRKINIYRDQVKGGTLKTEGSTGKVFMVYKDGTKKEVDINDLSDEDKNDLKIKASREAAETKTGETIKLKAGQYMTPQQKAAERINKLTTLVSLHPEYKDKYIVIDGMTSKPNGQIINKGGDKKIFDTINATLEGLDPKSTGERVAVIGPNGETGTIEKGDKLPDGWRIK